MTEVESTYAEWTFPAEPDAVRTARHAVRDTLDVWRLDHHVRDSAVLLVSELVTNSLQYTSGPIDVRLAVVSVCPAGLPGAALLVEVSDPLPDPPTARSPGPDDEGVAVSSSSLAPRAVGVHAGGRRVRRCGSSCRSLVRSVEGQRSRGSRLKKNETVL